MLPTILDVYRLRDAILKIMKVVSKWSAQEDKECLSHVQRIVKSQIPIETTDFVKFACAQIEAGNVEVLS